MAEEEVRAKVEAVYGDDCLVIEAYFPHFRVHLKPRTAEVSSQQDTEHVLYLVGTGDHLDSNSSEMDKVILHYESETIRRRKFEAILRLQQENNGLT